MSTTRNSANFPILECNSRAMLRICILVLAFHLLACGSGKRKEPESSSSQSSQSDDIELTAQKSPEEFPEQGYEDGEYCASIDYYNPRTGKSSTYELTVEVKNNELMVIQWPNGGWLDHSHFCCAEFDTKGNTSFTSDKNYEFDVTLKTKGECDY